MPLTPNTLLSLLGLSGQTRSNRVSLRCPFHDDRNPSAGFYTDSERFFCYTCQLSLDLIGFYAKYHGINRAQAETDLEKTFGELPKKDLNNKKLEIDRARHQAGKTLDKLLKNCGMKTCIQREELLERLLWKYDTGVIHSHEFYRDLSLWGEWPLEGLTIPEQVIE